MRKRTELERAYISYNRRFFGNQLPNPPEISVRWADLPKGDMGHQYDDEILISKLYRYAPCIWRETLIHEMAHMSLPNYVKHGKPFQEAMLRLAVLGAFKKLW